MPKLTAEQKGLIAKAKKRINDYETKQSKVYEDLIKDLDFELESDPEMVLFDYIYNDLGDVEDIEK